MKIRTAIFGVYVAASAAGFAVLMALILRNVEASYIESMRRTTGDVAALLARHAADATGGNRAWVERVAALPRNSELFRVFACDPERRVLFDSAGGRDVGKVYDSPMTGGGPAASENYTVQNVTIVGGELRVFAPVRRDGALLGWVGVGRPLASVAVGVNEARSRIAWIAGTVAVVMAAAGWWIATRLTRSLERLTAYARAVRDGQRAAPPASSAAEIAALARAFEEMRVTLEGKAHVERYTQALAHELKAPLSAIRGAAELLAENPPAADRERFVANLRAESDRLQLIVDRLLELAALEARRDGLALADVELRDVAQQVHDSAQATARARRVTLEWKPAAGARVRGEKFLLVQAVGNLVQNALEFTPLGGAVTLAVRADGRRATVTVTDTGPGVPAYAREKIFDRFYSLPRPDTGRKSSGLGLSIVREIARLHGGEIALEGGDHGLGTRAVLTLPLA